MPKYRKPPQDVTEETVFFLKHYSRQFVEWGRKNQDHLVTGILVVSLLLLGAVVYQRYAKSRADEAWSEVTLSTTVPELESAVAKFSSTPAGPFLKLRLADRYRDEGNLEKAKSVYLSVAASPGDFGPRARYSLTVTQESAGDFDSARAALQELSSVAGFWGARAAARLASLPSRVSAYNNLKVAMAAAATPAAASAIPAELETLLQSYSEPPVMESEQATEVEIEHTSDAPEKAPEPQPDMTVNETVPSEPASGELTTSE